MEMMAITAEMNPNMKINTVTKSMAARITLHDVNAAHRSAHSTNKIAPMASSPPPIAETMIPAFCPPGTSVPIRQPTTSKSPPTSIAIRLTQSKTSQEGRVTRGGGTMMGHGAMVTLLVATEAGFGQVLSRLRTRTVTE